jgi:hypothetical protein
MTKSSGLGDNLYVAGFDLSGDVGAVQTVAVRLAPLDVTGIDKSAHERVGGIADGEIAFNSFWDTATDAVHDALSTGVTTDRLVSYFRGSAVGNAAANLVAKQIDFNQSRGQDGSLLSTVQALGSSGVALEWGKQLTAGKVTHASATNGTSIDNLAATTTGAAAYLQVFSLGSGTVAIDIEDSADDSSFASIMAFTNATTRTAERVETAAGADVRQYVRVATSGTFTNAVIAVTFVRYADPPA